MNLDGLLLAFAIAATVRFFAWLAFRKTSGARGVPDWCGPAGEVGPHHPQHHL